MNLQSHKRFLGDIHHPAPDYSIQYVDIMLKYLQIVRRNPKVLLVSERCRSSPSEH